MSGYNYNITLTPDIDEDKILKRFPNPGTKLKTSRSAVALSITKPKKQFPVRNKLKLTCNILHLYSKKLPTFVTVEHSVAMFKFSVDINKNIASHMCSAHVMREHLSFLRLPSLPATVDIVY